MSRKTVILNDYEKWEKTKTHKFLTIWNKVKINNIVVDKGMHVWCVTAYVAYLTCTCIYTHYYDYSDIIILNDIMKKKQPKKLKNI